MSRANITGFMTALAQPHVNLFPMFELQLEGGTQYWCGLPYSVTWNGNTYLGTGGVVSVSEVAETGGTAEGLQIVISGALPANKSLLVNEKVQNRKLVYRLGALDASDVLQVDPNVWSGAMDYMQLDNSGSAPQITIYAEHYMILWDKPKTVRYTDAAQKRIDPSDRGIEFVAKLSETTVIWPSKAALKG